MDEHRPTRREFLKAAAAGGALGLARARASDAARIRTPNIIFFLADDLGRGEVGCYGQELIRTPHIDALAREGMRFTQHYSGSPVCAPSRCTLMTGKHTGRAYIRDNFEMGGWNEGDPEGQRPIPAGTETIARMLRRIGYRTAAIGKWGLGGPDSSGDPLRQGFDHFYGHLCQRIAHNHYTTHLWRDGKKEILDGNRWQNVTGKHYAPDLMAEDALRFIRERGDRPFFLYFATPVPHAAIQVPEDSLAEYRGRWPDPPYTGDKGYLPHPAPRAGYAAMVTRMDRDLGRMMALLEELGIADRTIVFLSSDNGPTFNGGTDSTFFRSARPFRGLKCEVYEGGIRVPMIVRWPGRICAGSTAEHVSAFWDVLPTIAEATGAEAPRDIDGVSFLPTLLGEPGRRRHDHLYWEYHGSPSQAVRLGDWKGVRRNARKDPDGPIELYDLACDIGETRDLAKEHPGIAGRIREIMASRTPSEFPEWNFRKGS